MEKQQAHEDLRFIREMLEETRRTVCDNGMHYFIWSVMPALGIIGTYLVVIGGHPSVFVLWTWVAAVGLGAIASFVVGTKESRARTMNFADRILASVWIASGITMSLIAFGGMLSGAFSPHVIPALIAVVMGIPFFISGLVYDLRWFKLLSVGWWTAGVAFLFWDSFHALAVLGLLILLLQAVPGMYLYRTFGKARRAAAQ